MSCPNLEGAVSIVVLESREDAVSIVVVFFLAHGWLRWSPSLERDLS